MDNQIKKPLGRHRAAGDGIADGTLSAGANIPSKRNYDKSSQGSTDISRLLALSSFDHINSLSQAEAIAEQTAAIDHLTICFEADGRTTFYPETMDNERLYRRLKSILKFLHRNPERVRCAAGACKDRHGAWRAGG